MERSELDGAVERVKGMLEYLSENCTGAQKPFEYLMKLEKEKIFLG